MTRVFQAQDTDEPFQDTDFEDLASQGLYGVISGCSVTYDATDMTFDVAAGTILHNGSVVTVAAQADVTSLVSDGSNERWTAIHINSSGTAAITSGDPAADGSTEPTKPEIGDVVVIAWVKIQAAQTIANNCEYKLDKRIMVHRPREILAVKTANQAWTNDTTFADVTASSGNLAFAIGANETWIAMWWIPATGTGGSGGFKAQFTGPAAPTTVALRAMTPQVVYYDAAGATDWFGGMFLDQASAFSSAIADGSSGSTSGAYLSVGSAGNAPITIHAVIVNGANAGTVTLQAAQNASNAAPMTILAGAYMIAWQVVS